MEQRTLLSIGASAVPYLPTQYELYNLEGFLTEPSNAGPLEIATEYLKGNATKLGLTEKDFDNIKITDLYTDSDSGITHIYLRELYNGIEVSNANLAININSQGSVINVGGGFVPGLNSASITLSLAGTSTTMPTQFETTLITKKTAPTPQLTASNALQFVATELGLVNAVDANPTSLHLVAASSNANITTESPNIGGNFCEITTLQDGDYSLDPIPAELCYVPLEDGNLVLTWNYVLRTPDGQHWYDVSADASTGDIVEINDWVDHASYNVFARPVEAPTDGSRTILTDPNDTTASPYGWHDTNGAAGAEYTDTRGNNVFAQEDVDANNSGGFRPSGGASLSFDFPLDLTQAPSVYQSAAITNLFYWNNLLHDIHYRYGFTEVAGNFQQMNYTGQGLGNDPVQADAQDGSGTNNANFATPPDGQAPRMQMFKFTYTTPNRDGDIDNQIIVHEYGHGVSNRLVGGPSNVSALSAVQSGGMGEGWSDWWGLMFTQKTNDAKTAKYPVGTYVLGQTPTGAGIRRYPYSFDMAYDPLTYGNIRVSSEVHNAGEIWCSALWDMNWLLIDKYGFNPDITNGYTPGSAGNILALKLVMDSLKLMPVNPSFLKGRDAMLLADMNLTGGANQMAIWTAFARRGMGYSAYDGGSGNSTNVTEAFDLPPVSPHGTVAFSSHSNEIGKPVTITVRDSDLSGSPTCPVTIVSSAGDIETVSLAAQGGGIFQGSIVTSAGAATPSDGTLQTVDDGTITVTYNDANDGTGSPAVVTDQATMYNPILVTSTSPPSNSTFTLPGPFNYEVTFNEPVAPASVKTTSLVLSGIAGATVTGVMVLPGNTTVRFILDGITAEGTLTASLAAGAVTDTAGNPSTAYSASYSVDFSMVSFPVPLKSIAPVGSLIYNGSVSGTISPIGDSDTFTINVDPGQTISVLVTLTGTSLQPSVQLLDTSDTVISTATAAAAGQNALIQAKSTTGTASGIYKIIVSGATATTGDYTVQVILNAALELEGRMAGAANNTLVAAQDISGSFINLMQSMSSAMRGAILGQTDLSGIADYYSFTVVANDTDTIAVTGLTAGNINLDLLDSSGTVIASGNGGSTNLTKVISNLKIVNPGTYYAKITGDSTVQYSLVVRATPLWIRNPTIP